VPDARLDRLTAMFNPKKRVPATVEFADNAGATTGAQALVDVAAYKNADALVHVVRAFRDEAVAHASGSVKPVRDAQTMEDELILADLGVAERRLERLEKDLKKTKTAELETEKALMLRCKEALGIGHASARPVAGGRRPEAPSRLPVPLGQAAAGRDQPR
jgi:ribosome-binding ATPase YchF (GTP1/OBG family)